MLIFVTMFPGLKIPKLIRWIFWTGIIFLILMSFLRLGFFLLFDHHSEGKNFGPSFLLGFRFDLKMVCILMGVILLAGMLTPMDPFRSKTGRLVCFWIVAIAAFILCFFYVLDFAYYSYLSQRLSASVLNYLQDAGISLDMVWQTYPVVRLILLLVIGTFLIFQAVRFVFKRIARKPEKRARRRAIFVAVALVLIALGVFGNLGQFPLRWSDAFALGSDYRANLALNPFQSFFSSLKFRNATFNRGKVADAYPVLQPWYGFPGSAMAPDYTRRINQSPDSLPPNVVIVICESFSMYKSSMSGNPLNTTPYFASLCRGGVFFDRCFTPSYGTARGVWAVLTGIPDIAQVTSTSSRNPASVDQHSIMNDFKGYEKFYFLGGSASWANIRGLLTNNIRDLHLYEQQDYASPKIDVWGISDKNLFLEADKVLKKQTKPFVAIIQTADNHRPYSIPEEDKADFPLHSVSADSLRQFGFESNEEMNAFRYTDYGYRKFMEAATRSPYFKNTIFVFVGDHGIPGNANALYPKAWTDERLDNMHVPLLFYAPSLLAPRQVHDFVSQLDLLPSAATAAGISYSNTTLGRNLLDSGSRSDSAFSFIYDPEQGYIGLLRGSWLFREQMTTGKGTMYPVTGDTLRPVPADTLAFMKSLTNGIYETARYMLLNNKKRP